MKLAAYLAKHKISSRQFATKIGGTVFAVRKWRIDERIPRPAMIAKIRKATRGKVNLADWYERRRIL